MNSLIVQKGGIRSEQEAKGCAEFGPFAIRPHRNTGHSAPGALTSDITVAVTITVLKVGAGW